MHYEIAMRCVKIDELPPDVVYSTCHLESYHHGMVVESNTESGGCGQASNGNEQLKMQSNRLKTAAVIQFFFLQLSFIINITLYFITNNFRQQLSLRR